MTEDLWEQNCEHLRKMLLNIKGAVDDWTDHKSRCEVCKSERNTCYTGQDQLLESMVTIQELLEGTNGI